MESISGSITNVGGKPNLVIRRQFAASAEEVWHELTDSHLLQRWLGRWEGDPRTGSVAFFMTAEGADVEAAECTILECDRPRRFAGDIARPSGAWHLWFELEDVGDGTILTFGQRLDPGEDVGVIGPGWEYYLDRLVAAYEGIALDTVEWDRYYPAMSAPYRALLP